MFREMVGQSIDSFQIISLLGEGGMGAVLKGYDQTLQREVAIKLMHPHLAGNAEFQKRFLQEARTAARLDHPSIVHVYSFGKYRSMLYIVMKFIPGDNLDQMLAELRAAKKWVMLGEAVEIVRQVAQALEYAHQNGVLHRDIKPSNIMIEAVKGEKLPYRPIITDLGLAKLSDGVQLTQQGTSLGTPAYMSPEQALGKSTDARSDVYSLGILLFELATARLPFPARSLADAIQYHAHTAPPLPRSIRAELPEAVEKIILCAMEKDPAQRYPNAGALAQALGALNLPAQVAAAPTAMENTVSLITQYQKSLVNPRGNSVLNDFQPPANKTLDQIQVLTASQQTSSYPLKPTGLTVGRDSDNDIVLDDTLASRHHMRIEYSGTDVVVSDLNSTNGTFLESARLLPGVSEPWDEDKPLRIGQTWLRLRRGQTNKTGRPGGVQERSRVAAGQSAGSRFPQGSVTGTAGQGRVNIALKTNNLVVEPGQSVTLPVLLQNQGAVVDHFQVRLSGVPEHWLPEPMKTVPMMPGDQKEVSLTVAPPRAAQSRAGQHALTLSVTSRESPSQVAEVRLTLSVGAYTQFTSEMHPQKLRAGQTGRITVRNLGNAPENFTVTWKDRGDELAFRPPQAALSVPEGQSAVVNFQAAPRHRQWIGREKNYAITGTVAPARGDPQPHMGEVVSRALLPPWVTGIPVVLCVLLGMLGMFLVNRQNAATSAATATAAQAVALLEQTQTSASQTETAVANAQMNESQAATATAQWLDADDDRDGLINRRELELNLLPNNLDTDGDGLSDGEEVDVFKSDPLKRDTDGDRVKDGDEAAQGTDPLRTDSDGDGTPDGDDNDPRNVPSPTPMPTATTAPTPTPSHTPAPTRTLPPPPIIDYANVDAQPNGLVGEVRTNEQSFISLEVRSRDGRGDGDGIREVLFKVSDEAGNVVYQHPEQDNPFCIFADEDDVCSPWHYENGRYFWGENGQVVRNGLYTVEIYAEPEPVQGSHSPFGVWYFQMELKLP